VIVYTCTFDSIPPPASYSCASTGSYTPPPPRRLAHRILHAARRIVDAAAVLVSGVVAAGGEAVASISTSEESPGDGGEDPAQRSRAYIEALIAAEAQLDVALEKRGPARIYTLDGRGLATLHGPISLGKAAGALSRAFERHRAAGDEVLIRFADQGAALFLTDGSGEPPEDSEPLAGEARGDEEQVQAGGPFNIDSTIETREPQGISPDREAAERAINLLIRKGFAPRLSCYPTNGRGPILCALSPTAENINRVLDANMQGASAGILIHGVREDLPEGQAPKAGDLEPRGLMLDLDGARENGEPWTAEAILERLPMKPALIVETSRHRFHVLAGPLAGLDLAAFKLAGKALADRFHGADPVTSPTKTIRLPGSLNSKDPARPFVVRAVEGDRR
jgi:hypothetical protein